jgi:hypothetical protein
MTLDPDVDPTSTTYLAHVWPWPDKSGNWSVQVNGITNIGTIEDPLGDWDTLYQGTREFIIQEKQLSEDANFAITLIMGRPKGS